MDVRCDRCDTLYHLSPAHAGLTFQCDGCHEELTVPAPSASASGALFLVCGKCGKGFSVEADGEPGEIVCPHCDAAVDLCQSGETLLMQQQPEAEEGETEEAPPREETAPTEEPEGRSLGGYHLEGRLAETPLGSIHLGEQVALRRRVTVYILRPDLARDPAGLEAFLDNARMAAGLVHPSVARVYDVGAEGETAYVVSECVKGETLAERIAAGHLLAFDELGRIGAQSARALAAAHAARILHFGLSPASIAVTDRGEARLMHFGITRALFAAGKPVDIGANEGFLALAPEQIGGGETDARSDLYSLGVTLFAGLLGSYPYAEEELRRAGRGKPLPPPPLREMLPDAPPALARLLDRLIAQRPEDRFADANETAVELESFARSAAARDTPRPPALERANKRRYKRIRTDMDVSVQTADLDEDARRELFAGLENLSENGAFISTDQPLAPGSFVNLSFALEGASGQVKVLGLVRWVDETPGQMGMGVQFLEVSTRNRRTLNRYVDRRAAGETAQHLATTALHKAILRFLVRHWGEETPIQRMMQGAGAGKALFERTLVDFEKAGLAEREGDIVRCIRPESEALNAAIEELLQATR